MKTEIFQIRKFVPKQFILATLLSAAIVGLAATGCSTGDRTTGRYIDDRMVAHHVKSALSHDPVHKFPDVYVTAYDGVVQLSGFANAPEQIGKAGEIASRVQGVQQVINNIALKPQGSLSATGSPTGRRYDATTQRPPAAYPNGYPTGYTNSYNNTYTNNNTVSTNDYPYRR